jgi:competence ComEA-like helix-hairpin-helix protein
MWNQLKDYFSFSRKDIRGIYVLLAILMLILLFRVFAPNFIKNPEPDFTEFDRMVLTLEKAKRKTLENERAEEQSRQLEFNRPDREIAEVKLNPFPFDPNDMSGDSWIKLGLNKRQVRNIQNFLASGGRFRKKEDFKRIYTISDEEYEILQPFITIAEEEAEAKTETGGEPPGEIDEIPTATKSTEVQLVNINIADSLELLRVRGIGPVFARRIIRYRDLLGGFHSADQLLEVYGLDSTKFEEISGSFLFDHASLNFIDVNSAEIKDLTSHPYIDFYLAKSIVDERIKKGGFASDADLYGIPLMHDALYVKIIPYFQFNQPGNE